MSEVVTAAEVEQLDRARMRRAPLIIDLSVVAGLSIIVMLVKYVGNVQVTVCVCVNRHEIQR